MDFTITEMYLIYNIIIFLIFMINYIKFVDKEKNLNILFGLKSISLFTMLICFNGVGESDFVYSVYSGYESVEKLLVHMFTLIAVLLLVFVFLIIALVRKKNMSVFMDSIYLVYVLSNLYSLKTYVSAVICAIYFCGIIIRKMKNNKEK